MSYGSPCTSKQRTYSRRSSSVVLEMRQHDRVVLLLAGVQPGPVAERAGAGQLRPQVGRDARRLLVVAARDPDEARLERLEVVSLLEGPQLLEQPAELRPDLELVRDPVQRGARLRARFGARRRHLRLLVPGEEARGLLEVVDLAQPAPKLEEAIAHRALTRRSVAVSSEVSRRSRTGASPDWTRTCNAPHMSQPGASEVVARAVLSRSREPHRLGADWVPVLAEVPLFAGLPAGTCAGSPRSLGRSGSRRAPRSSVPARRAMRST